MDRNRKTPYLPGASSGKPVVSYFDSITRNTGVKDLTLDLNLLTKFENQLEPARLTASRIPVSIVGRGNLSVVFELQPMPGIVFKRLPPFPSSETCGYHLKAVEGYRNLLHDQLGIPVVEQRCVPITNHRGEHLLYIAQVKQNPANLAPNLLKECTEEGAQLIYASILSNVVKVWHRNAIDAPHMLTGLDARISNWALHLQEEGEVTATYLDTSTPFFKRIGKDLPTTGVFLKRVPSPFLGLVRQRYGEFMEQFYDLRLVLIDFLADFHTEKLGAQIPLVLGMINGYLTDAGADFHIRPITEDEVTAHHRESTRFWRLFRRLSRMDRALRAGLLRRHYPYILPDKPRRRN